MNGTIEDLKSEVTRLTAVLADAEGALSWHPPCCIKCGKLFPEETPRAELDRHAMECPGHVAHRLAKAIRKVIPILQEVELDFGPHTRQRLGTRLAIKTLESAMKDRT